MGEANSEAKAASTRLPGAGSDAGSSAVVGEGREADLSLEELKAAARRLKSEHDLFHLLNRLSKPLDEDAGAGKGARLASRWLTRLLRRVGRRKL